jgi:hypothetical protein
VYTVATINIKDNTDTTILEKFNILFFAENKESILVSFVKLVNKMSLIIRGCKKLFTMDVTKSLNDPPIAIAAATDSIVPVLAFKKFVNIDTMLLAILIYIYIQIFINT